MFCLFKLCLQRNLLNDFLNANADLFKLSTNVIFTIPTQTEAESFSYIDNNNIYVMIIRMHVYVYTAIDTIIKYLKLIIWLE